LTQTFSNFEILLIDGASTDKTVEIARNYGDERIKIFVDKDSGIFDAMNKGIRFARGKWIYFLGSDDQLYSMNTLDSVANELEDGIDVLYGNVYSTRFKGLHDGKFDQMKIFRKNICHQAIFFRRDVFDKIGNFDLRYRAHADWDHNMRWFLSTKVKHKYCDLVIANYADGGFSSAGIDVIFKKERGLKFLHYSKAQLSKRQRISILLKEIKRSLREGNLQQFFTYILRAPGII
jgi:glycosyltransferase involved in cell wall biosynthesis